MENHVFSNLNSDLDEGVKCKLKVNLDIPNFSMPERHCWSHGGFRLVMITSFAAAKIIPISFCFKFSKSLSGKIPSNKCSRDLSSWTQYVYGWPLGLWAGSGGVPVRQTTSGDTFHQSCTVSNRSTLNIADLDNKYCITYQYMPSL